MNQLQSRYGHCGEQESCSLKQVNRIDKNKLNGTYVYRQKHNYIPYSTFTITKVQLRVSAINVGHLQVVHEEFINKLYQYVWGVYSLWAVGGVRDLVLCWIKGCGLGVFWGLC